MNTATRPHFWLVFGLIAVMTSSAHGETLFYSLENILLDDGTRLTGIFSWTFDDGDFENGTGQFAVLDVPWTSHDQDDLTATFDPGSSIEITLEGNFHDDGVDISLFVLQSLTPDTSAPIDLARSKYDIGGNGFHDGMFLSGTISPTNLVLSIEADSPGFAVVSWVPDLPGFVLQEATALRSPNWMDSASGSTNPVVIPASASSLFYRLSGP